MLKNCHAFNFPVSILEKFQVLLLLTLLIFRSWDLNTTVQKYYSTLTFSAELPEEGATWNWL